MSRAPGFSPVSPLPTVNAEEVAVAPAAAAAKGKKSRAKKAAQPRIDLDKAEAVAWKAKMKATESARVAKAKAEEAEEAARIAKAKAEEAEEAAWVAEADAEEAAKARKAEEEARQLMEKETEWAQCEEELVASMFRGHWNRIHARHGATFKETSKAPLLYLQLLAFFCHQSNETTNFTLQHMPIHTVITYMQLTRPLLIDAASIPPMCYTYPTPEEEIYIRTAETLQIVSLKIVSVNDSLHWPLEVFGMVAVRDILDHKRNIIFQRQRNNCQIINENVRILNLHSFYFFFYFGLL